MLQLLCESILKNISNVSSLNSSTKLIKFFNTDKVIKDYKICDKINAYLFKYVHENQYKQIRIVYKDQMFQSEIQHCFGLELDDKNKIIINKFGIKFDMNTALYYVCMYVMYVCMYVCMYVMCVYR